jgi:hypothetical protein
MERGMIVRVKQLGGMQTRRSFRRDADERQTDKTKEGWPRRKDRGMFTGDQKSRDGQTGRETFLKIGVEQLTVTDQAE